MTELPSAKWHRHLYTTLCSNKSYIMYRDSELIIDSLVVTLTCGKEMSEKKTRVRTRAKLIMLCQYPQNGENQGRAEVRHQRQETHLLWFDTKNRKLVASDLVTSVVKVVAFLLLQPKQLAACHVSACFPYGCMNDASVSIVQLSNDCRRRRRWWTWSGVPRVREQLEIVESQRQSLNVCWQ